MADYRENKIAGVSLDGGLVHTLSSTTMPNGLNSTVEPCSIATHPDLEYALVVDWLLKGLVAVDLVTGQRVIISKSSN